MNEESIKNITDYLEQNPDIPTEQLVLTLQNIGYTTDDLKEALRRQGLSPILISGYKEPDPPPASPFFSKTLMFMGGSILILCIIVLSAIVLLNPKKEVVPNRSGRMQQEIIPESTPTSKPVSPTQIIPTISTSASNAVTTDDPLKLYKETFVTSDYKITVVDKEISPEYEGKPASSSQDSTTAYTQKGVIFRFDQGQLSKIFKGTDLYLVNHSDKKYTVIPNADPKELPPFSFIPTILISESGNKQIRWEKIRTTEWSGVLRSDPNNPQAYTTIIFTVDEKTNLLTKMSTSSNLTHSTQEILLTYEKISDVNTYLQLPSDYTKKN